MTLIPIADAADPRIAPFCDIRERDLVGRKGHFIAEGRTVLEVLIRESRMKPLALLLAEGRLDGLAPLLTDLDEAVPVYVAAQSVLDNIAGFSMHRGVLALGAREPPQDPAAFVQGLGPAARLVVLVGIANHDNMGGIFRNAAAFGIDGVLLDHTACDPLYRKSIRVSAGGALVMPFARFDEKTDCVAQLAVRGFTSFAFSPNGNEELSGLREQGPLAFFFGAEGPGLPARILERVRTVRIAMPGGMDSLNVATASGIVLHHFMRGA